MPRVALLPGGHSYKGLNQGGVGQSDARAGLPGALQGPREGLHLTNSGKLSTPARITLKKIRCFHTIVSRFYIQASRLKKKKRFYSVYSFLICFLLKYLPVSAPIMDAQCGSVGCLVLHSTGGCTALGKSASCVRLSIIDSSLIRLTTTMPLQTFLVISSEIIPSSGIFLIENFMEVIIESHVILRANTEGALVRIG